MSRRIYDNTPIECGGVTKSMLDWINEARSSKYEGGTHQSCMEKTKVYEHINNKYYKYGDLGDISSGKVGILSTKGAIYCPFANKTHDKNNGTMVFSDQSNYNNKDDKIHSTQICLGLHIDLLEETLMDKIKEN